MPTPSTIISLQATLLHAQLMDVVVRTDDSKDASRQVIAAVNAALIGTRATVITIDADEVVTGIDRILERIQGYDVVVLANIVPTERNLAPFTRLLFSEERRVKMVWHIIEDHTPTQGAWNRILNRCVSIPRMATFPIPT